MDLAKEGKLPEERLEQHHFRIAAGVAGGALEEECTDGGGAWTRKVEVVYAKAEEVFADFQANEVRANKKYKGKTLLVIGEVSGIDADVTDEPLVKLKTSNQFMSVGLRGISEHKAAGLDKGDAIKVVCQDASEVGGTPFLSGCELQ